MKNQNAAKFASAIIRVSIHKGEQELCGPHEVVPNYDSLKATLYKESRRFKYASRKSFIDPRSMFCDATILSTVSFLNVLREKKLEWGSLVAIIVVDSEMEHCMAKIVLR